MDSETFRSRLLTLLQKSRQAFRLYSSVGKAVPSDQPDFGEMQAAEWRNVNGDLIRELSSMLERSHGKDLSSRLFFLRDRFQNEFRVSQSELHAQQKELITAAENGDFVRVAVLSRGLISKKARLQATQAVQHELDDLIVKGRLAPPTILLTDETVVPTPTGENLARVIPLRRRS